MIRAVLFDLDGVLTDTERLGGLMINEACRLQGFSLTDDEWKSMVGTPMEKTANDITALYPSAVISCLMQDWKEITLRTVRTQGVPQKSGATQVLHALKDQGYQIGLCTNNTRTVISEYLQLLSWNPLFDTIVSAEDVQHRKPAPDTYLLAADRLRCSPSECAGIEDSPAGLSAVWSAGMHCILIPDLINVPPSIPRHAVLHDLHALPDYLKSIN